MTEDGTVALLDRAWHETGCHDLVFGLRVRWFPVPSRGDLGGGAVVPAIRIVLPRRVEELLAERGVTVDHVTIYRWVQRFTPGFVEAARTRRHVPGDRWFVDETYVKVNGRWTYLYRAVDQYGQVIDVWLFTRRDLAAARTGSAARIGDNQSVVPRGAAGRMSPCRSRILRSSATTS